MKLKRLLIFILTFIILTSTMVFATEVNSDEDLSQVPMLISEENGSPIDENLKNIDNDYFVCENNTQIKDISVTGNLFVVCGYVNISNVNVTGSIFVTAESIELTNVHAEGSLYVGAENISCMESSFKNIYTVSRKAQIIQGTIIEKNAYTFAQDCTYNATVNNEAGILGSDIVIGSETVVGQNLNISSKVEPEIPQSASIKNYNFNIIKDNDKGVGEEFDLYSNIIKILAYTITTIILAIVIIKCMPNFKEKSKNYEVKNFIVNILLGMLFVVIIPVIFIMLMVTGFGIRLGFIILLLYILAFIIATPISCILIALFICKKQNKEDEKSILMYISIIALIVSVLEVIPIISGVVTIILGLLGFGTIFVLPASKLAENNKEV